MHCSAPCLGQSYRTDEQVTDLILGKLPGHRSLVVGALALWLLIGVGTGVLSAWRRGGVIERLLTGSPWPARPPRCSSSACC